MPSTKKIPPARRGSPDLKGLGRRLRELRGVDITQEELAVDLGISQSQLSKYERGAAAPSADILFYMKQRFQISIDWLLTGDGPKILGRG
jgi:transcriptional regulator with XRE-family HTH domain